MAVVCLRHIGPCVANRPHSIQLRSIPIGRLARVLRHCTFPDSGETWVGLEALEKDSGAIRHLAMQ